MNQDIIYFDNAATTFPKPDIVYRKTMELYQSYGVNAGRGSHKLSRKANEIIEETRVKLGNLINFKKYQKVILTPSATIALNQIINGLDWDENKVVYVSPFEHNAIMRPLHLLRKRYGFTIETIPFNKNTFELEKDKMLNMFALKNPSYVFVSHISNVTGFILPIEEIIEESKKYEAISILDCAQSLGLIDFDIKKTEADFVVFAGHKSLYGPFGVGGYFDNSSIILKEYIVGGTGSDSLNLDMPNEHPKRYEAASKNNLSIFGLNVALDWIQKEEAKKFYTEEKYLTNILIDGLRDIYGIDMYIPSNLDNHIGVVSFNLNGYNPNELGQFLDEDFNIAVRTGYHCAPLVHDFLGTRELGGTVRVSLGAFNSEEDISKLINDLETI